MFLSVQILITALCFSGDTSRPCENQKSLKKTKRVICEEPEPFHYRTSTQAMLPFFSFAPPDWMSMCCCSYQALTPIAKGTSWNYSRGKQQAVSCGESSREGMGLNFIHAWRIKMLLRQTHQGGGDGCRMWHAWRKREIYKGVVGKYDGKRPIATLKHKWDYRITKNLSVIR